MPTLGTEPETLALEAALDDHISTTKGCYTGQEVVARLRTRGQVKHKLVGLRFEGGALPEAGTAIAEVGGKARRIGEVTSACVSPLSSSP